MSGRSLAVTTGARCPLSQPAGAAIVSAPAPRRADAQRAAVEARAFAQRLRAEGYDVAARRLEGKVATLEHALATEPILPSQRAGEGSQ